MCLVVILSVFGDCWGSKVVVGLVFVGGVVDSVGMLLFWVLIVVYVGSIDILYFLLFFFVF